MNNSKGWTGFLIILFGLTVMLNVGPPYTLMLTAAQMLFVPIMLLRLIGSQKGLKAAIVVGVECIVAVQITDETQFDVLFAAGYFFYSLTIAFWGITRFLKRGFKQVEEFMIDAAMVFLAIGGIWFFATISEIDTGFSPIITWLTAIHFHYASFLLPVFTGLLGRIYKPVSYPFVATLLLISPFLTAIGITFSVWIELLSVLIYIVTIGTVIVFAFKTKVSGKLQTTLIRVSFSAIGLTILFSLLYALSNSTGLLNVEISFMLVFHGVTNCILFGALGVIAWSTATPDPAPLPYIPVSKIRGQSVIGEAGIQPYLSEETKRGLVDDFSIYRLDGVPIAIQDFYLHTEDYHLFSVTQWKTWFKPFAFIYKQFSRRMKQLNLPLESEPAEMTGSIQAIDPVIDGRSMPRAWIRKIGNEEVFVALYSQHIFNGKAYMNIALPLPKSALIGILKLHMEQDNLILSSETDDGAAGIYLAVGDQLPKLPISEKFTVWQEEGKLKAIHQMKLFNFPFLTIHYEIFHKEQLIGNDHQSFKVDTRLPMS